MGATDSEPDLQARLAELEEENRHLRLVAEINGELGVPRDLADLVTQVIIRVTELLDAERSTLFLYDREADELWTLVGEDLEVKEIRLPADQGIAGHVARSGELLSVPDAYDLPFFDRSWDAKTGFRTRSVLCLPLHDRRGGLLGVLQVLNKHNGAFTDEDERLLRTLGGQLCVHVENAALHDRIEALFESIVCAISVALDSRDPVTAGHSRRVTGYALNIARAVHQDRTGPFKEITFTRAHLRELRYAGLLHDFGKVGVPEAVLQKAERLPVNRMAVIEERVGRLRVEQRAAHTDLGADELHKRLHRLDEELAFLEKLNRSGFLADEAEGHLRRLHEAGMITDEEQGYLGVKKGNFTPAERKIMEGHVVKTRQVLDAIPWLDDMKEIPAIAAGHHEEPAGTGYPDGLSDGEIPLGARILAVADVYDALTAQDRPYKPAIGHSRAASILQEEADRGKLQPELVEVFLNNGLYQLEEDETTRNTAAFRRLEEAVSLEDASRERL